MPSGLTLDSPQIPTQEAIVPPTTAASLDVARLRTQLSGRVIGPDDAAYDEARAVFYGAADGRPAVIVKVANAADVARVVGLARKTGLELAVRSGGHSGAGHSTTDGGIVLDLSDMKAIEIDVDGRTVWAETGLTAVELSTAVAARDLAIGFGDTGSVGIGGITLGGGIGYLVRAHGLTIDNLLAADIVTADGQLVRADATSHPDLFWAIRGGGGNFGVATRFQYRLHPVPAFTGGMLILPATAKVIAGFVSAAEAAPDELTTIANVMPAPPMPMVPEEQHGKLVVLALMAYAGDAAAGERALAPFRSLATPIADLVQPIPYPQIYPPDDGDYHPIAAGRTMFVDRVDREVAQMILARLEEHQRTSAAQMVVAQLRVLGGAMARVPADATAFAHRSSRILVNLAALVGSADELPDHEPWVDGFLADLRQGDDGAYVNFINDEGDARVRQAYPGPTWERLAEIKRRYDPTNLFRRNQNIAPAAEGSAAR
jgi:FAD binding domain/Berberine and berberine like